MAGTTWGDLTTWGALTTWWVPAGAVAPPATYTFVGPTFTTRMDQNAGVVWFPKQSHGITVWRDQAGVWHTGTDLDQSVIASAQVIYRGGYTYTITQAEADALTAAGFGSYIK